jgi:DNA-directed RNA polymerase alpha subunit
MENKMTHQEARKRLSHFAEQVKELKQSLSQIERAVQNLLKSAPIPLTGNKLLDACNQIDYGQFTSKLSVRARKTLYKLKIKDSASLAGLSVFQLQCVTNCGETTVAAIVGRLAEYGISLPQDITVEVL